LIPDNAVASSLLPIEYVYLPRTVLFRTIPAMMANTTRMITAFGKFTPGMTLPVEIAAKPGILSK